MRKLEQTPGFKAKLIRMRAENPEAFTQLLVMCQALAIMDANNMRFEFSNLKQIYGTIAPQTATIHRVYCSDDRLCCLEIDIGVVNNEYIVLVDCKMVVEV